MKRRRPSFSLGAWKFMGNLLGFPIMYSEKVRERLTHTLCAFLAVLGVLCGEKRGLSSGLSLPSGTVAQNKGAPNGLCHAVPQWNEMVRQARP